MLNDKLRRSLRHLPHRRKWPAFETGIVHLPATRIAGGWAAAWAGWHPWELLSFTLTGERAQVRSLADSRIVKTISHRELEHFSNL